jgi:hypothetical protein
MEWPLAVTVRLLAATAWVPPSGARVATAAKAAATTVRRPNFISTVLVNC